MDDLEAAKLIDAEAFEMGPGYWGRQARRDAAFEKAALIKGTTMSSKMSHDRVRFVLADNDRNQQATSRAAQKAFGMTFSQAYEAMRVGKTIICRPSQFARFLIYRSAEVTCNSFKQFNAELIPSTDFEPIVDVTRNAA